MSATMPRYRVPRIDASVGLDDFSDSEIADYLLQRGFKVFGDGYPPAPDDITDTRAETMRDGLWISHDDLLRIEMLSLCGQTAQALQELADIVSEALGRPI